MLPRQPGDNLPKITGEIQSAFGYIRRQKWTNLAAGTATAVHAAITLADGATTTVTTAITNPAKPRIISVKGNAAGIAGNVIITGTNIRGEALTETIVAADNTEVFGLKAFKTVTSIVVPARNAGGDTISIGTGDAIGLDRCMAGNEVIMVTMDGTYETTRPTVTSDASDVSKNTINPDTAFNGALDMVAVYVSTEKTAKRGSTT